MRSLSSMPRLAPFLLVALSLLLPPATAAAQVEIGGPIEVEDEEEPAPRRAEPVRPRRARSTPERAEEPREPAPPADEPAPARPSKSPDAEPAPARAAAESDAPVAIHETVDRSFVHPTENEQTILALWKRRLAYVGERDTKRAEEVERELRRVREVLALENLFTVATALVREADDLLDAGSASDALARCGLAVELAPDFNLAHLCVARATLSADFLAVGGAVSAGTRAVLATFRDVRSRRHAIADEGLTLLFALVVGAAALLLLVVGRYAGLFFHDFNHLFPKGVASWQTALVALTLVTLPALLGFGLLGSVAAAAIAISLLLSRAEAIALGAAFVLLAGSRLAMAPVARAGAFGGEAQDVYLLERGEAPEVAVVRLQARLDTGTADYASAFALGRYYKRFGRYVEALAAYDKAQAVRATGELLTDIGNVRFLQGDLAEAETVYRRAIAANGSLAAPRLNLAKICFRQGRLTEGEAIKRAALALRGPTNAGGIVENINEDTRANLYLPDTRLADAEIELVADRDATGLSSVSGAAWTAVVGRSGGAAPFFILLLAAALVALAQALQQRVRPSSKCEKCGRPVCARCDPELGSSSGMCGQCISVFVRRTGVDPPDRIRKEIEVRRFRRRQRIVVRAVGFLVGGGGHVLAGRVLGGAVFLFASALLVTQVVFWQGFLRPPAALGLTSSPLRILVYAALLLLVYVLSVRHLLRHEETD